MQTLELLAPAKNLECGIAAIDHGADAVYIGAPRFGARASAGNSLEDIAKLCQYAHQYNAHVHVTVNTIIYEEEFEETLKMISDLNKIGVDALLLQDLGVCKEWLARRPDTRMQLHASTQCDTRDIRKVKWLNSLGFDRIVLARELSAEEISAIHREVPDVELEVFVHGALCVSYSGACYASQYCFNRSANRGACAQFCRMKFDLLDTEGNELMHQKHLLSLKDMCQIEHLEELAASGACSFKIEGRLKDVNYVKNVVSAYSQRLNKLVEKHPDKYRRASEGKVEYLFNPDLKKTFNRGYINYFLKGRQQDIVSFDTPKALGEYVGKVKDINHRRQTIIVAGTSSFANGDGLCFINELHNLEGFRINRVEGNHLYPLRIPEGLQPGMALYRNNDVAFEKILAGKTAERNIEIDMHLDVTKDGFVLRATPCLKDTDCKSHEATVVFEHQMAQKPQADNIKRQLSKLGNTIYTLRHLTISEKAEKCFIPSSVLSELRHNVLSSSLLEPVLEKDNGMSRMKEASANDDNKGFVASLNSKMCNIANKHAIEFYKQQGVDNPAMAYELKPTPHFTLMQCRHCLRFTLGYCVKNGGQKPKWKEPLSIRLGDGRSFRLHFNCQKCQMEIIDE